MQIIFFVITEMLCIYIYIYAKYAPGDPDSKQIMIDSSMLGVKGTAEVLAEIVQRRFGLSILTEMRIK